MEIMTKIDVVNLDLIDKEGIVIATTESGRMILSRSELFKRLEGRKRNTKKTPAPKTTKSKIG